MFIYLKIYYTYQHPIFNYIQFNLVTSITIKIFDSPCSFFCWFVSFWNYKNQLPVFVWDNFNMRKFFMSCVHDIAQSKIKNWLFFFGSWLNRAWIKQQKTDIFCFFSLFVLIKLLTERTIFFKVHFRVPTEHCSCEHKGRYHKNIKII